MVQTPGEPDPRSCQNCGSNLNLVTRPIIPVQSGGTLLDSNSVVLCRSCNDTSILKSSQEEDRQLCNFWLSRDLYSWLKRESGVGGMGNILRHLMNSYSQNQEVYQDIFLWEDQEAETRISVWVPREDYNKFKLALESTKYSVTDTLKSLLLNLRNQKEN